MENQVEEVKNKTDIVSIISERIEVKKAGRNFKANCPFHGERTPSFMISPELQIFKCFGCGKSGDVFTFLEDFEGMDFGEALKYLADKAGIKLKEFEGSKKSEKERLIEVNTQAIRFYNYLLLNHEVGKKALSYLLNERGLKKETIEEFQLGFSPIDPIFLRKFLIEKKKFSVSEIEKAGIIINRGSSFFDRFSGRVIFPLFDHRGNAVGFSGRVLPWDIRETGKYINSPETLTYHKSEILYGLNVTRGYVKKKGVAIIVEGELDVISSYQAGIKNVVAIKGSALTEEQVKLLARFASKFILALDTDLAGDTASRRGIMIAERHGIEVKVSQMQRSKDPDEAARSNLSEYKNSLINAISVWDFFINSALKRHNPLTGIGKAKISKEVIPVLGEIEDKIVQAHYVGQLAKKLRIPEEAVLEEVVKITKKTDGEVKNEISKNKDRKTLLEDRFLALCFLFNPKILNKKQNQDLVSSAFNKRIIEEYEKFVSKNNSFDLTKFSKSLPAELFSGFSQLVLEETGENEIQEENIKKELDLVSKEIKILSVKEKLVSLAARIKNLEEKGDKNEQFRAQQQFTKLASLLSEINKTAVSGVIFSDD